MIETEFDTSSTDEIICPHCGHEFSDSWEHNENDGDEIDCSSCNEPLILEVWHSVKYSTTKVPCDDRKPPVACQWAKETQRNITTQEDIDRYKREGSCLGSGKPKEFWIRTCVVCAHDDFSEEAEPNGPCIWKTK